ncbi:unnamed protein product [Parascedosporium putredinis]|uniref:Uncharacterized protein n=1 Tax=Parascedosporium putredinis TaxID=1442378 RepID=A0A9P1H2P1_9PEZI|nr:unnamed protein product [Parascedosporium putredinis]CAI7994227.1 unnamed protein product [Parascedosporium putredinis]
MAAEPSGFALRKNGTCLSEEVDCGRTVDPYRVCCPADSFCPAKYNVDCCPTAANCTTQLIQTPACANETWDLYDNGGYFCCERGLIGYAATRTGSNGCASPGYAFQAGEVALKLISAGTDGSDADPEPSTTGSTTFSSSNPAPTAAVTTPPPESASSGTPAGAIAGGVIGGLAALALVGAAIWWFRKRKAASAQDEKAHAAELPHEGSARSELDGGAWGAGQYRGTAGDVGAETDGAERTSGVGGGLEESGVR